MEEEQKNIKENILKTNFKLVEVIIIVLICTIIGIIMGYSLTMKFALSENKDNKIITKDENLNQFIDAYETVLNKYYKDVDKKELINSAISGMVSILDDPYSVYLDEESKKEFDEKLEGSYKGVGVEISINESKEVYVVRVFENSPAKKADIKVGDVIVKVNDKDVTGKTTSEVSSLIKSSTKSDVTITVKRNDEELKKELNLSRVTLDSVTSEIINNGDKRTGYIKIEIFAANTYIQFKNQLENLEEEKIDNLIIDVRDNSGGYLDVVTDMASLFMNKDKILYKIEEKNKITNMYSKTKESRKYKIVVITNEYSASASEILAAALKESYGATTLGKNTYGKGTVQQTENLTTGGMLKFTTQKWLTPKGAWINEVGLEPTIAVEQSEKYYQSLAREDDNQLQKALEIIIK